MISDRIKYIICTKDLKKKISKIWSKIPPKHWHLDNGFTLVALDGDNIVGFISVQWKDLPSPIEGIKEGFIDIIEVIPEFRKRGIGSKLVLLSEEFAIKEGAYQLRAWSSEDKVEAIPMWYKIGFGLCPATIHPGDKTVSGYFVAKRLTE